MEQLKQLMQAVLSGDQNAMQQFQQLVQDPQQGPQVVQAIQAMAQQGDPDAQQFVQMLQGGQGQPMSAKLGGKLRTVASLNNICPEGYELKIFKAGGTLCKKCMKAQDGTKVTKKPTKPISAADEYKASKKTTPVKKQTKKHYSDEAWNTYSADETGPANRKPDLKGDAARYAQKEKAMDAYDKERKLGMYAPKKKALGGLITPEAVEAFKMKCGGKTKMSKKKTLVGKKK